MTDQPQGHPGADRAVGRPGPAVRMTPPITGRRRVSVLIPAVRSTSGTQAGTAAPAAPPVHPPQESAPEHATVIPTAPSPTQATSAGASPSEPVADQWTSSASEAVEVTEAAPKRDRRSRRHARAEAKVQSPGSPRSARLFITHVDPWSVMKQAFLLALAIAVIILVAAAALWFALDSAGVLDAITRTATDVGGESGATVGSFFGFGTVMGAGLIIAAIETVLVTALSTLFAFMYNLSVGIGGGLEVTLSEEA